MSDETTHEGVEEKVDLTSRDSIAADMAARRAEEMSGESVDDDNAIVSEEELEEELEATPVEDVDDGLKAEPDDESGGDFETIKVYGKERKVTKEELIEQGRRAMQKESAADEKLRQAAAMLRQAEELSLSPAEEDISAVKTRFAEALLEDEEVAGEMYAEAILHQSELEKKINQLERLVSENNSYISGQRETEQMSLANLYKNEFPELAGDEFLSAKVNRRTAEIMQSDPTMPHRDILLQAGNDVRAQLSEFFGSAGSDPRDIKERMPKQASKTSARLEKKPKKQKTQEELISAIQKQRMPV